MRLSKFTEENTYFTFNDGLYFYNCIECGFKCCKGEGFGATKKELLFLKKHYPMLPYFTEPNNRRKNTGGLLMNFKPKCFFLEEDGLCKIHRQHGRLHKPFVCKTFPANNYYFSNNYLIVGFNFLCPLQIGKPSKNSYLVTHNELLSDINHYKDHLKNLISSRFMVDIKNDSSIRTLDSNIIKNEIWCRDEPHKRKISDIFDLLALTHFSPIYNKTENDKSFNEIKIFYKKKWEEIAEYLKVNDFDKIFNSINDDLIIALYPEIRMMFLRRFPHIKYDHACNVSINSLICAIVVFAKITSMTFESKLSIQAIHAFSAKLLPAFYLLGKISSIPNIHLPNKNVPLAIKPPKSLEKPIFATFKAIYKNNKKLSFGEFVDIFSKKYNLTPFDLLKGFTDNEVKYFEFSK